MWLNVLVGAMLVIACAALAWPVRRWHLLAVGLTCVTSGALMVAGVVAGLPLFPLSDVVVLVFAVTGGVLLGRAVRTGVVPFLIVLVVLSVLDVTMNALFTGGPPAPARAPAAPDPHLIWLNFPVPLPAGRFNIGFGDLLLIAAMSVHLRSRCAGHVLAAAPGVIGLGVALLFASLPGAQQLPLGASLSVSLVPFLTIGWLAALAASRITPATRAQTTA